MKSTKNSKVSMAFEIILYILSLPVLYAFVFFIALYIRGDYASVIFSILIPLGIVIIAISGFSLFFHFRRGTAYDFKHYWYVFILPIVAFLGEIGAAVYYVYAHSPLNGTTGFFVEDLCEAMCICLFFEVVSLPRMLHVLIWNLRNKEKPVL